MVTQEKKNEMPPWVEMDKPLLAFSTWEEYLDSLVNQQDLQNLESIDAIRAAKALGLRVHGEVLGEAAFYKRRTRIAESEVRTMHPFERELFLFSLKIHFTKETDVLVRLLAYREAANKKGFFNTIIFIRHRAKSGYETSGYIDYADRLRKAEEIENWKLFFDSQILLVPKTTDLGYFHWHNGTVRSNVTRNYVPINHKTKGMVFQNRNDHKIICPCPAYSPGQGTVKIHAKSDKYKQIEIYDHEVRRRT